MQAQKRGGFYSAAVTGGLSALLLYFAVCLPGVLTGEGITFTTHRKVPSTGDNTPLTIALVLSAALALGYVALMLCRRKMS